VCVCVCVCMYVYIYIIYVYVYVCSVCCVSNIMLPFAKGHSKGSTELQVTAYHQAPLDPYVQEKTAEKVN